MSVIKLENVSKFYKSTETVSIGMQKVNLEFSMGEFVAVTGESGSGKSTLLNVVSGLDSYEEGEFYLFGEETSHFIISDWEAYRSAYVGFVFQNYNIIDSYTVLQNVLLALEVQGYDPKKKKARALELIDEVGLSSHINHKASKLSGGQKQRAVIARALAKDCPIIVADEPTGNLDSKSAEQVMELLHNISRNKLVIVVTHDFEIIEPYATRKIKMHDGEVVEDKHLKKIDKDIVAEEPVAKKMNFITLMKFAFRNLISTPKRTFFILLMQMIVMLAFTLIYASEQSAMLQQSTSNISTNINVTETRLLVEKRDGSDLTQADFDYFNSIREVKAVYEKGRNFYNDIELFAFNLDNLQTYAYYYGEVSPGDNVDYYANFAVSGTDAASLLDERDFEGRMPSTANEIIIDDPSGDFSIGDRIVLSTQSYAYGTTELGNNTLEQFVVTGITNKVHGDELDKGYVFFSDQFLASDAVADSYYDINKYNMVMNNALYNTYLGTTADFQNYIELYNVVDDGTDTPKFEYLSGNPIDLFDTVPSINNMTFTTYLNDWENNTYHQYVETYMIENVETYYYNATSDAYDMIIVNNAFYELLRTKIEESFEYVYLIKTRDSASISVASQSAGNRVIDRIDTDIYRVYYPANIPAPLTLDMIFLNYFYNAILIIFGLFLYSIVHAVSKNTMRSRSKDFAIYRSIGAQKTVIARLVVVEQVMIAFGSIVFMLIAINSISYFIASIRTYLTILTFNNYLYLFILFMLFGAWLGLRFNKRVFKQSVIENINISKEVD